MSDAYQGQGLPTVYFVGAGPGDPALLTVRAAALLADADVVLYDRLSANCQPLGPTDALWECVEQLPGCHPDRVGAISRRMLEAAQAGKRVVRLKGGDSMIFGRAAEEWHPLIDAGIPVEVVPGVTAALAAAAGAMVSLTDRRVASAVALVTGHENPDKPGSMIDWSALAQFPGTLVFYMGVARLGHLVDRLTHHGKPETTPVALVSRASFPDETIVQATLGTIESAARLQGIAAPAITIVGEVSRDSAARAIRRRPLRGAVVLTTRPAGQERPLLESLARHGAVAVNLPVLGIGPPPEPALLDAAIDRLRSYDWVVFFSANGVKAFFERLLAQCLDARCFGNARVAAIGRETSKRLLEYGIRADLIPQAERSEGLAEALVQVATGARMLLVRADRGREQLEQTLHGIATVVSVAAYVQVDRDLQGHGSADRLISGKYHILVATSGQAFAGVLRHLDENGKKQLINGEAAIVALGQITAAAVTASGYPVAAVAKGTDLTSLTQAVVDVWTKKN